jgi:UDP-N-acetylmuramoylalanine--D-glutamate ligase
MTDNSQFNDNNLSKGRSFHSKKFEGKKVLILGLGLNEGGVGSARFFAKSGAQVKVTDLKTREVLKSSLDKLGEFPDIEYILGEHRYEDIDWADIIIRNPALRPDNEYRVYAEKSGKIVETDVGIFLQFVSPQQMIGITGTKGKSTTSNLIYYALKEHFGDVILAGNIGKSVLDSLDVITDTTKVVLELSSFQLEAFAKHSLSPHMAVITNILPDHLNYYSSMDEYSEAKRVIGQFQTTDDWLFIQKDDSMVDTKIFLQGIRSHIERFSKTDLPEDFEPTLLGEHNLTNYAAALVVAKQLGVAEADALKAMNQFQGAEFRLQLIKKTASIKIYNDSASTMPDSTIKALEAIKSPILIVGGMDKGLPYEKLAHEIDRRVKAVYFIDGTATEKLRPLLQHRNIIRSIYTDFDALLKDLKLELKEGDTILFSPAATSFNFFQNEFDRGQKFNEAINRIFKER